MGRIYGNAEISPKVSETSDLKIATVGMCARKDRKVDEEVGV